MRKENYIYEVRCPGMKLRLSMETLITLHEYRHTAHGQLPSFFHTHITTYESQLREIDSIINRLALHVRELRWSENMI